MRKRRAVLLAVGVALVALVLAGLVGAGQDDAARVADDRATTSVPATTAAGDQSTTTVPSRPPEPVATAEAPPVGVGGPAPGMPPGGEVEPGLVVTNTGSATASAGGNIVVGGPGGDDPPATIVTGRATAVGNVSSVRAP